MAARRRAGPAKKRQPGGFGREPALEIQNDEGCGGFRSVHAGDAVMAQTFDFVLYQQFTTFELHDFKIIDRGVRLAFVDLLFERLVLFFEFHDMRLHRHAVFLLKPLGL
jgi:hypothetical protein